MKNEIALLLLVMVFIFSFFIGMIVAPDSEDLRIENEVLRYHLNKTRNLVNELKKESIERDSLISELELKIERKMTEVNVTGPPEGAKGDWLLLLRVNGTELTEGEPIEVQATLIGLGEEVSFTYNPAILTYYMAQLYWNLESRARGSLNDITLSREKCDGCCGFRS